RRSTSATASWCSRAARAWSRRSWMFLSGTSAPRWRPARPRSSSNCVTICFPSSCPQRAIAVHNDLPRPRSENGDDMTTTTHTVEPAHLGQLIGGEERAATQTIEVRNPGRLGELVGTVADGDVADVEAAVAAADAAAPGWAATSPQERVAIFERIADAIEA